MKTPYNYCLKCHKWLGWPRWLVFWEKAKICSACQKPKSEEIEIIF